MNRKLHNTILAFSVTGVMLFVGLVVAEPVPSEQDATPIDAPVLFAEETHRHDAFDAAIEARVRQFDIDLADASDPAEALALTVGLIAATATEAALQSALGELRFEPATREPVQQAEAERRPARRSSGSRDVIAVPYFSFARGSRGTRS